MLTTKQLQQVHSGYAEYVYRWDYYMRSYMGAEEYRDGAYLRKYIGEEQSPGDQYAQRLLDTALHNHAKVVVDTYRSFIFRNPPTRTMSTLVDNEFAMSFVKDSNLDGMNMTQFMREVNDTVSIYGNAWIGTDRPAYTVDTAAQEADLGIRAYAMLYDPTCVLDWSYGKQPNGAQQLNYIKVVEGQFEDYDCIKIWTPETIEEYIVTKKHINTDSNMLTMGNANYQRDAVVASYGKITAHTVYDNPLGYVPFQCVMDTKSFHRGIGTSDIGDVCDIQRTMYNKLSELYSNIRLSSHPSIVAEPSAEINGGAGAIIYVDEQTQIQPYLLQPTGASIDGIISAIQLDVEAIDASTHLKAVKAKSGSPMSGVAMQTEKALLNAKLSDRANMLQRAEQKLWKDWFNWQGILPPDEFEVHYEKSFDLRDKHSDLELYRKAIETVPHDSFVHYLHDQIAKMLVEDEEDLQQIVESIAEDHKGKGIFVPGMEDE